MYEYALVRIWTCRSGMWEENAQPWRKSYRKITQNIKSVWKKGEGANLWCRPRNPNIGGFCECISKFLIIEPLECSTPMVDSAVIVAFNATTSLDKMFKPSASLSRKRITKAQKNVSEQNHGRLKPF